ncbi:flagellar protein FlaG [Paenibacillus glycanilyticus]|uniref:flagellar protein FlaG n=1 Tax=Paenibacillus glycanilyticus TaxID=126569 RepID=UPI003EBBF541
MNSNISISGSNFPSERTVSSESTRNDMGNGANTDSSLVMAMPGQTTPSFTRYEDVKTAEQRGERLSVGEQQLVKNIEQAIKALQGKQTELEFNVHKQTHLVAVKVKDKETGEVLREIPPEKSLDFIAKLWEMAGLVVDEKR